MRLGMGNASIQQPRIHLVVGLHPQPRGEESLTHQPDLVLDLTLFPTRGRCAGHGINQIMTAHLQKSPIVLPLLAHEDRIHRGLHVVVDAARAGALEEREGALVRVEHHLLRLTRIGSHERHPAVAQPHVRDLHRDRRTLEHYDLVAPVELVGFARCKPQWHERAGDRGTIPLPTTRITADRIVAASIAAFAQGLENPDQRQPLPQRPRFIGVQQLVQFLLAGADPRQGLFLAAIAKLRRPRTHNLADHLPRYPQLTADLPDRLPLTQIRAPDLRYRLHCQHPVLGFLQHRRPS